MKRITHFINTIQTNWSEDPAARGAAKMTTGAVLIVEGLFGLIRSGGRRARGRRKNKAGGLLGGFIGVAVGFGFIFVGSAMGPSELEDEIATEGTIYEVITSENDEGETRFTPVYEFDADGQTYTFRSTIRSSSRPTIGQTIQIAYSASNPQNARRTDGLESKVHWLFIGSGIIVLVISLISLAISIALIVFGIYLFRSGRADRQAAGETGSFFSDLMSIASRASRGEIDLEKTAAGQGGSSQGEFKTGDLDRA